MQEPLPVKGYTAQPDWKIAMVNDHKELEETILQVLDKLADSEGIDKRWLAIGRTQIEQGFMAINRAVFQPRRPERMK